MLEYIKTTDFSEAQRLFHGRGHAYPSLAHVNLDWLKPVMLLTLYQEVSDDWLATQVEGIRQLTPACRSVQVQYRCRPKAPTDVVWGEPISTTTVIESGLQYHISLGQAQNTGLFLDMRNGREWVRDNATNKSVLNLFAYTCAFSVAAIAGGAAGVVNIDISKASLAKGRDNHRLNEQTTKQVRFEGVDIFKSNSRIKKYAPYQLMICDPPSFQKGSVDIARDYPKIIRRIPQWMAPNSQLLLCLNSPDLDEDFLKQVVASHCPECQFEYRIDNPEVYQEAHQGKGLKALVFRYLPS